MYNLEEVTVEDLTHMKRYIGELVFFKRNSHDNEPSLFLKTWYDGEAILNSISFDEIKEIFSNELFNLAQERPMLLDLYADIDENDELYNIKELIVYDAYLPAIK